MAALFSLYALAREGNTLFHILSITVSNKAFVPKGSSWHEAQKIRQALNTLCQCWVNWAFVLQLFFLVLTTLPLFQHGWCPLHFEMFQKHALACFFLLASIYYLHAFHTMLTIPTPCVPFITPMIITLCSSFLLHAYSSLFTHCSPYALHAHSSLFTYTYHTLSTPQPHFSLVYKQL